jgi:hypothetical protein
MNSILERVKTICDAVQEENRQAITFKKLIGSTRRQFRRNDVDIILKTKKDRSLEYDCFYVHAFYDPGDDYENEISIEVLVYHNFNEAEQFKSTQIQEFLTQIYDAVVHELRHQHQSRKRKYQTYSDHAVEPYSKYLADPDELDAYALSIAIELLRHMPLSRAKKYMSRISVMSKMKTGSKLVSPNLNAYVVYFGQNSLIKKLSKKVYKHLETIDTNQIF